MDQIKRILGILWISFAVAAAYFCIFQFGLPKLYSHDKDGGPVFGSIILFILTPLVVFGLTAFGIFALKGEYSKHNMER